MNKLKHGRHGNAFRRVKVKATLVVLRSRALDLVAMIQAYEIVQIFLCIGWGISFVAPYATLTRFPFYAALLNLLPQAVWLVSFFGVALVEAVAMLTRRETLRREFLRVSCVLWLILAITLSRLRIPNPYAYGSFGLAFGCLWAYIRSGPAMTERRRNLLQYGQTE